MQLQERNGFSIWALELRRTAELIGYCGLIPQSLGGKREAELVYLISHEYWNQGFATEAAIEVRDWAFARMKAPRVISIIDPLNAGAIRVAEKTGMRYVQNVEYAGKDCRVYAVSRPMV
jgi:[ribosomal protein S5]-alanine N-acetyltransferase